jgi:hypothetical protein
MWQQDNQDFGTSCWRFCIGILNSHVVDAINSKHIDFNIITTTFKFKLILFTSNLLQVPFNCSCVELFALLKESPPIQFHVHITRGYCSTLSIHEHRNINCLCSDKRSGQNKMPMILELVRILVMCTKKTLGLPKKVVNDTLNHVISYQLLEIATTHH